MKLRPIVERVAQFGYLARGTVYVTIGVLALKYAVSSGGAATDARGALYHIFHRPFGSAVLAAVGVGLLGHAMWRFIQASFDTEEKGRELRGVLRRVVYFGAGVFHVALFLVCMEMLSGLGGGTNRSEWKQWWVSVLLSHHPGEWIVFISGLGVAGAGIAQFYLTCTAKFMRRMELHRMSPIVRLSTSLIGRIGHAARGVVFSLIGVSLMRAALDYSPGEAWDFGQSLRIIMHQPYGRWLLAFVATGLVSYGLYTLVLARYRRIDLDRMSSRIERGEGKSSDAEGPYAPTGLGGRTSER